MKDEGLGYGGIYIKMLQVVKRAVVGEMFSGPRDVMQISDENKRWILVSKERRGIQYENCDSYKG